jgi:hypothetical protein
MLDNKNYFKSNLDIPKLNVAINSLDNDNYLFSPELLAALLKPYDNKSNEKIINNKKGIFLIAIRVLNKEEKSLVYNYIYYDDLFYLTLVVYFLVRNYFIDENNHESGKYLVILDNKFLDYNTVDKYIDIYKKEKRWN